MRLVDGDVARAVHGLGPVRDAFDVHGAEHALAEILQMPRDLEHLLAEDVRGVDEVVPVTEDELALELLDLRPDDRAPRMPEYQPRTDSGIG